MWPAAVMQISEEEHEECYELRMENGSTCSKETKVAEEELLYSQCRESKRSDVPDIVATPCGMCLWGRHNLEQPTRSRLIKYPLKTHPLALMFVILLLCSHLKDSFVQASPPRPIVRPETLGLQDFCEELGVKCVHGTCQNDTKAGPICVCDQGWKGHACDTCGGRVK